MPKAVIFTAVSSEAQTKPDKISLPEQERLCRAWCEENGYSIVKVLSVPGFSRRESDVVSALEDFAEQRIFAYHELREMWYRDPFDVLVCYHDSRLGRSSSLYTWVVENTVRSGARIYRIDGGWIHESDMRIQIALGNISATEGIDRLVRARRAAMDQYAKRGLPTSSSVIVSHRVVRDALGRALRLEVDESKRRLWDDVAVLVLEGVGWHRIEIELYNRFGHVKDDGKPYGTPFFYHLFYHPTFWGNSARHFNDRNNRKEKGLWAFDPDEPAPDYVTIHYGTHDPVYTGDLAEQIKAELRRRHGIRGNTRPDDSQMFTGLFVCAECGYNLVISRRASGDERRYYRCVTHYRPDRPGCSQRVFLREDKAQTYINARLSELLAGHDFTLLAGEPNNETSRVGPLEEDIGVLEAQIRRLILKQASVDDPALRQMYDDEILSANERLKIMRSNLVDLRRRLTSSSVLADRQRAHDDLAALTLDVFWQQSSTKINQLLHRLMGNRRFVVRGGEITGTTFV
jgi:DNA invertase Pin-like site-specific DNA recombinase